MNRTLDTVSAAQVALHDEIINVGIVDGKERVGVFVVLTVRGTLWTLGTGRGDIVRRDLVLHETDDVVVVAKR